MEEQADRVEAEVEDGKITPGCVGCGGTCKDCDGNVPPARKGAGRPRKFCCYNCKQRAGSRAFYRREYKTHENDERAARQGDINRVIQGHEKKGHDGKPCPAPWPGATTCCRFIAELYDDMRAEKGLNRVNVGIIDKGEGG